MAKVGRFMGVALAAAFLAGSAGMVFAADAATSIAARKAAMKATAMASVKLRNPALTAADAKAVGKTISDDSKTFAANIAAGTGPESGVVTKAKAEIWTDKAGFKAELDKSMAASAALMKASDDAAAQTAAKAVLATCNSCHTKYRAT
jgi:cytochrome c556